MGYRQAESQLAAVGFQYTNENAVESEVVVSIDDYGRPNNIKKGSGCVCGVTSHSDVITELRDRFRIEYTHYLCLAINLLQDEGKVETEMDRERLFNAAIRGENFEEALIGAL